MKGYIYIRTNEWCEIKNVYKVGITHSIKDRNHTYITGEIIRGYFIKIFELDVNEIKLRLIDNIIKLKFEKFKVYINGGTEFYDKIIIDKIDIFLIKNNIIFKLVSEYELYNINQKNIFNIFIEKYIKFIKIKPIQLPSKIKYNLFKLIINEPCFKKAIKISEAVNEARSPYISKKQIKNIIDNIINKYPDLSNEEILLKMKEINNKISIMATVENVEEQLFRRRLNKKEKEIIDKCFEIKFYLNIKNSIYDNFKWIDELI
jgi:hypothetical protein